MWPDLELHNRLIVLTNLLILHAAQGPSQVVEALRESMALVRTQREVFTFERS